MVMKFSDVDIGPFVDMKHDRVSPAGVVVLGCNHVMELPVDGVKGIRKLLLGIRKGRVLKDANRERADALVDRNESEPWLLGVTEQQLTPRVWVDERNELWW